MIRISSRYRVLLRIVSYAIPILSIAIAAIILPYFIALPVAIVLILTPYFLKKVILKYNILLFMPLPTENVIRFLLGTTWYTGNTETLDETGLGLLFKYKSAAQDAYNMLKAWNYNKLIDKENNIECIFINEGESRYTIIIYPGDRYRSINYVEHKTSRMYVEKSEADIMSVRFTMSFCLDYSKEDLKITIVEALPRLEYLNLNTFYIDKEIMIPFAKRSFKLYGIKTIDRKDVVKGSIEDFYKWKNPDIDTPIDIKNLATAVNKNYKVPRKT